MSSNEDSSHWRGDSTTECDDRSQTNDKKSTDDQRSLRDQQSTDDQRSIRDQKATQDQRSLRDHHRTRRLSFDDRSRYDIRSVDRDQHADDSQRSADGDLRDKRSTRDGSHHDDSGPMPWLTVDFEATPSHFGGDDNVVDLDENSAPRDDGLMGQTSIQPSDTDQEGKWEWLKKLNDGWGESGYGEEIHKAGVKRDLDIICDRLGATEHQHERAEWLLSRLDIKEDLLQRGSVETILMGVVSMVIDEDRTRYARQGVEGVQSVTRDDRFKRLRSEFDINNRTIHTVRRRLRETEVYESPNN